MKASELRIGNIIESERGIFSVQGLELMLIYGNGNEQKSCRGIPLTEEWLLKFGLYKSGVEIFEEPDGSNDYAFAYELPISVNMYFVIYKKKEIEGYTTIGVEYNFKYVHQLQNIYFALTDEELTIKHEPTKTSLH